MKPYVETVWIERDPIRNRQVRYQYRTKKITDFHKHLLIKHENAVTYYCDPTVSWPYGIWGTVIGQYGDNWSDIKIEYKKVKSHEKTERIKGRR